MINNDQLRVDFIDVGQGDCIGLLWENDEGNLSAGIIDCANFESCKLWIEENKIIEIDFLLISHPHLDHYLGINQLLKFIKKENILLKEIWITFEFGVEQLGYYMLTQNDMFDAIAYKSNIKNKLSEFLHNLGVIESSKEATPILFRVGEKSHHYLNSKFSLHFLGPNTSVSKNFIKSTFDKKTNKVKTKLVGDNLENPNANVLSSSILIKYENKGRVLFTSDIITKEKKRVLKFYNKLIQNIGLLQVPHHGSKNGFRKKSLNTINSKNECIAVISVGTNIYDHPKKEIVNYYRSEFKELYSTGKIETKKEVNESLSNSFNKSLNYLDMINFNFPKNIRKIEPNGTQSFILSEDTCEIIK